MPTTLIAEPEAPEPELLDDDLATFDRIDGYRVERNMSNEANQLSSELVHLLKTLLRNDRGVVSTEIVVRLAPGTKPLRPDVVFIACAKVRGMKSRKKDPWDVVPDLVVEVVSPSNRFDEIDVKLERYFDAGVTTVLVVSSRTRRVAAYASTKSVRIHEGSESVELAPALPGLTIALDDLYAPLEL